MAEEGLKVSARGFKLEHGLFADKLGVDAEQTCMQLICCGKEL